MAHKTCTRSDFDCFSIVLWSARGGLIWSIKNLLTLSWLRHWYWGNHKIGPVPFKQQSTQWCRLKQICVRKITSLFQIMACRLVGAKPLSGPMLECCYLEHGRKLQWNLDWNLYIFIQDHVFETVAWTMSGFLSRSQCVKNRGKISRFQVLTKHNNVRTIWPCAHFLGYIEFR